MGCPAADGEFQEFVILRVTAGNNPHAHIDPLGLARQRCDKHSDIFLLDISTEIFSAQNFVEFSEGHKGEQDFALSLRRVKSFARFRIGQEQRADDDVRIEDAAQLRAFQ